jgi:hypothetical protein
LRDLKIYQDCGMKHHGLGSQCGKTKQKKTRDVSNCGLAIYIKKYLKAKEQTQIFHLAKI